MIGISGFQEEELEEMVLGGKVMRGDGTTMRGEEPKEQRAQNKETRGRKN